MIRQCKFAGFAIHPPCKELMEGVHQFFTPDFGVCFGYNVHNQSNDTSFSFSIIGGRAFGLQLIIDIEGIQYFKHQKRCLGEGVHNEISNKQIQILRYQYFRDVLYEKWKHS